MEWLGEGERFGKGLAKALGKGLGNDSVIALGIGLVIILFK